MVDLDKLKELAKAATPGPWTVYSETISDKSAARAEFEYQLAHTEPFLGRMFMLNGGGKCPAMTGCGPTSEANAAFIAAANPAAVLELIAALTSAKAEIERLKEAMQPRPVEEAEEKKDYLVYGVHEDADDDERQPTWWPARKNYQGIWFATQGLSEIEDVTHFLPLTSLPDPRT